MKTISRRILTLFVAGLLLALLFLSLKGGGQSRPLPPTSLTFVGLSNLPPLGLMTAFSLSNATPERLAYDPQRIDWLSANKWTTIQQSEIVNGAALLAPGGTSLFYVPGTITNGSLRLQLVVRRQAKSGPFGAFERLVTKLDKGSSAWLGGSYSGVLTETRP